MIGWRLAPFREAKTLKRVNLSAPLSARFNGIFSVYTPAIFYLPLHFNLINLLFGIPVEVMVYGTDNLCAACQRDGNDSYDGAPHHDSWHSFQEAIEQGCKICAMLWSSFSNQEIERLKATGPLAFDTAWADRSYAEDVNDISGRFVVNTSTGTLYKPFFFKRLTGNSNFRTRWIGLIHLLQYPKSSRWRSNRNPSPATPAPMKACDKLVNGSKIAPNTTKFAALQRTPSGYSHQDLSTSAR